jgi:hypothetical protein
MSKDRMQPLLSDVPQQDTQTEDLIDIEDSQGDVNESDSNTNLVQRRGNGSGDPQSHLPGSSQTSNESNTKDPTLEVDVEAQTQSRAKARAMTCFKHCCCGCACLKRIEVAKWYEWLAYYIPILEWLPGYKCNHLDGVMLTQGKIFFAIYLPA